VYAAIAGFAADLPRFDSGAETAPGEPGKGCAGRALELARAASSDVSAGGAEVGARRLATGRCEAQPEKKQAESAPRAQTSRRKLR